MKLALAATVLPLLAAGPLQAQAPAGDSATVIVVVLDAVTKQPVEGAQVIGRDTVRTDYMGEARLRHPRSAQLALRVRHATYAAIDTTFNVGTVDWQLMLAAQPSAPRLQTTTVTAEAEVPTPHLNEFRKRMAQGRGKYITSEELAKGADRKIVDMIVRLPGLTADASVQGRYRIMARSGPTSVVAPGRDSYDRNVRGVMSQSAESEGAKPGHCQVALFMDGTYIPDLEIGTMHAAGFAGVEYYTPTNVPPEYRRPGMACGILLLWSR